jgi:hypothetical protein
MKNRSFIFIKLKYLELNQNTFDSTFGFKDSVLLDINCKRLRIFDSYDFQCPFISFQAYSILIYIHLSFLF